MLSVLFCLMALAYTGFEYFDRVNIMFCYSEIDYFPSSLKNNG